MLLLKEGIFINYIINKTQIKEMKNILNKILGFIKAIMFFAAGLIVISLITAFATASVWLLTQIILSVWEFLTNLK